jgi:hypothetical protein
VLLAAELGVERLRVEAQLGEPAHHHRHVAVRDEHPLRAARADGRVQPRPVGVVGQHEAAVDRAPPARAAHRHPTRRERVARIGEAAHPGRAAGGRRREHQRAREPGAVGELRHRPRRRQRDAGRAVGAVQRLDRAVADDRTDRRVDAGEDPLRLAERVAEQHARAARVGVRAPPRVDRREHLARRRPAVDRQPERRLGDEGVAAHRLERGAGRVGLDLVVAADDPHLAAVLEAHLGRAEHVAGRMQRHAHAVHVERLAVGQRAQRDAGAEPRAQHALGGRRGQVRAVPGARVVGVGVGDHRPRDRAPGIDVEVAGFAVEPFRAADEQHPETMPQARGRAAGAGPGATGPARAPARIDS